MSIDSRARYLAGLCPCCGSNEMDNDDRAKPAVIGEGVMICGYCAYRHHDAEDVAPHILRAIITGEDT